MKKSILIISAALLFTAHTSFGQDIGQSEVPSVITNNLKQSFPKASDIEWEMDGALYCADFEVAGGTDHEVWYNQSGEMVKHKEEISKNDLPQNVLTTVNSDFKDFSVDDIEKVISGNTTSYEMELDSFTEEWKVVIGSDGKVLEKLAD